jgi:hypothetical protein
MNILKSSIKFGICHICCSYLWHTRFRSPHTLIPRAIALPIENYSNEYKNSVFVNSLVADHCVSSLLASYLDDNRTLKQKFVECYLSEYPSDWYSLSRVLEMTYNRAELDTSKRLFRQYYQSAFDEMHLRDCIDIDKKQILGNLYLLLIRECVRVSPYSSGLPVLPKTLLQDDIEFEFDTFYNLYYFHTELVKIERCLASKIDNNSPQVEEPSLNSETQEFWLCLLLRIVSEQIWGIKTQRLCLQVLWAFRENQKEPEQIILNESGSMTLYGATFENSAVILDLLNKMHSRLYSLLRKRKKQAKNEIFVEIKKDFFFSELGYHQDWRCLINHKIRRIILIEQNKPKFK